MVGNLFLNLTARKCYIFLNKYVNTYSRIWNIAFSIGLWSKQASKVTQKTNP